MAVTSSNEIWASRRSVEEGTGSEGVTTHVREFQVFTSDPVNDDGYIVLASVAARGTLHPNDPNAYLTRREAIPDPDQRAVWNVVLTYNTRKVLSVNPLADEAQISWSYAHFDRPAFKDKDGDGIVNSAGDPFDPAPTRDDSRAVVMIRKNMAAVPSWFETYQDAVNSTAFNIDGRTIAAGKAKIFDLRASEKRIANDVTFRTIEIEIHITNETNWDLEVLDQGYREKDGTNRKNIVNDSDSADPPGPILLNGSGAALSNPSPTNAVFETFEVYNELDFSVLPLV